MTSSITPKLSLGQWVRRLRQEREMKQEELACPGFSAAYVDAVEHDRVRPSDAALEVLAERLLVTPAALRAMPERLAVAPDFDALAEDFIYQIERTRPALDTRPADALVQVQAAAIEYQYYLPEMPPLARYR